MAVELMMGYRNNNFVSQVEESAVQEAACSGLESVEKLIKLFSQKEQKIQTPLSSSPPEQQKINRELEMDCKVVADAAVTKFKKVISLLGRTRTGHARFRRGPSGSSSLSSTPIPIKDSSNESIDTEVYCPTPIQQIPPVDYNLINHHHNISESENQMGSSAFSEILTSGVVDKKEPISRSISFSYSPAISHANSFMSSLTGETESKQLSSSSAFQITNLSQVSNSAGKPPLSSSSSFKRKCISENGFSGKCNASSGRCHCSKKRKLRLKRVIRVPAISMKMSDIPPDDYSWRKYGQKPIKGSPYPRGYYKCSSVRGCPARKHVERALDDPTMLIVTYEGEHSHSLCVAETNTAPILESS